MMLDAMRSTTDQLLAHIAKLRYEDLPQATVAAAKTFIEDSLGVALSGHLGAFTNGLQAALVDYQTGNRGARVWGSDARYPWAMAAMQNAYLIHCQEFDCVHEAAVVHPMAVILACLLSYADVNKLTGTELIVSVVAAVEIAATLGCASRSRLQFFRPAHCGALGAVAALAKLHGADAKGIGNAMAIMCGNLAGTMQAHREGAPLLPMQIAFAARNAVQSWQCAQAGLLGPEQFLEGEFGYFNLHEREHDFPAALSERLQASKRGQYAINEVAHKPFPSGRATHGGIECLQKCLQSLDASNPAHAIVDIELAAPPLIRQLVDRAWNTALGVGYHKLCFAFCAARVLQRWQSGQTLSLDVQDFSLASINSDALQTLGRCVRITADNNTDANALSPVQLTLQTAGGHVLRHRADAVLGSPAQPLTLAQHRAKVQSNFALFHASADSFIAQIDQLEALDDCRVLIDALPLIKRF
jgi:aconitate decarboxylase